LPHLSFSLKAPYSDFIALSPKVPGYSHGQLLKQ
jgi:hypothetical protein